VNHKTKRRHAHRARLSGSTIQSTPVAQIAESEKRDGFAFNLSKLRVTDLDSIKLDASEEQLVIEALLPVHGGESHATYEETIDFSEQDVPEYLAKACREMFAAALRAMQERVLTKREYPCSTCTGACCGREFGRVQLTSEDVELLRGVVSLSKQVLMYDEPLFTGHVGEFKQVPWGDPEDNETACPNLTPSGCAIYEHRPRVCHEYSAWDCDVHDEDPDKVAGRVHLRVRQS
jgi:Fe-S-cluster containining protein